jgi:hypothetical protein
MYTAMVDEHTSYIGVEKNEGAVENINELNTPFLSSA